MRVAVKGLGPGAYTVTWHALSVDTHKTQGSFYVPRRQMIRGLAWMMR